MDFVVLRGDRRQNLLCDLLVADGHRAQLVPEPEKWGMENLPPPGAFLVTAKASAALREAALQYGFTLLEYGNLPSFQEENGAITAEGALQTAMKHRLRTVRGSEALVIGYGGIGKPLASLLKGMKAEDAIARMEGTTCGPRPTSCPDQIAQALKGALRQL